MKWIFAFDHYQYACWGTVHLFDLMNLHDICPDIYCNLTSGNFSFKKSYQRFSKRLSIRSTNKTTKKLKGWVDQNTNWIIMNYRNFWSYTGHDFDTNEKPHHEDIVAFQDLFSLDVKKVIERMDVNSFLQDYLVKISNVSQVYDHQLHLTLQILLGND